MTVRSVRDWVTADDFPAKATRGWNRTKVDGWCRKHFCGPYRKKQREANAEAKADLHEATLQLTLQRAENERIKKERQLVEQATELEELLLREDVLRTNRQMIATVKSVLDAVADARDRELPARPPKKDTWPKLRARMLEIDRKLIADVAAAMGELLTE